jgi:cell volume regulation protein A
VLAALLALVIRLVLAGLLLWPVRLRRREPLFVMWAGLKGAVPILLGATIVHSGLPGSGRAFAVIFVVVAFSLVVQGGTVPTAARDGILVSMTPVPRPPRSPAAPAPVTVPPAQPFLPVRSRAGRTRPSWFPRR